MCSIGRDDQPPRRDLITHLHRTQVRLALCDALHLRSDDPQTRRFKLRERSKALRSHDAPSHPQRISKGVHMIRSLVIRIARRINSLNRPPIRKEVPSGQLRRRRHPRSIRRRKCIRPTNIRLMCKAPRRRNLRITPWIKRTMHRKHELRTINRLTPLHSPERAPHIRSTLVLSRQRDRLACR